MHRDRARTVVVEDVVVVDGGEIITDAWDDGRETREEDGAGGDGVGVVFVGVARVWHGIERCVRCARRELARGEVLCERRREPMDDVVHWGVGG